MKTYQIIITIQSDSRELPLIVRNDIMAAVQSLEPEVVRAVWVGALTDPSLEEKPWHEALMCAVSEQMVDTSNLFDDPKRDAKMTMLYLLERVLLRAKPSRTLPVAV